MSFACAGGIVDTSMHNSVNKTLGYSMLEMDIMGKMKLWTHVQSSSNLRVHGSFSGITRLDLEGAMSPEPQRRFSTLSFDTSPLLQEQLPQWQ
jgi:hypothetical protein